MVLTSGEKRFVIYHSLSRALGHFLVLFLTDTMFSLVLRFGTKSLKDPLRAETCCSRTPLSTQRSQPVLQTCPGSCPGL